MIEQYSLIIYTTIKVNLRIYVFLMNPLFLSYKKLHFWAYLVFRFTIIYHFDNIQSTSYTYDPSWKVFKRTYTPFLERNFNVRVLRVSILLYVEVGGRVLIIFHFQR